MANNHIALTLALPCSAHRAWDEITHWNNQSKWMLQTSVWLTSEIESGPGTEIAAFTGPFHKLFPRLRFLGVLDTMVVTNWQPPQICDVLHTGKIIKGTGRFEVIATSDHTSQFHWSEIIWAPRVYFSFLNLLSTLEYGYLCVDSLKLLDNSHNKLALRGGLLAIRTVNLGI